MANKEHIAFMLYVLEEKGHPCWNNTPCNRGKNKMNEDCPIYQRRIKKFGAPRCTPSLSIAAAEAYLEEVEEKEPELLFEMRLKNI